MINPEIQLSCIQALEVNKSFREIYAIEDIVKEQLKMQKQELDHQKVLMEVKIENLKLLHQINELEERLDVSECSKKILEMSIDKLKFNEEFLESKIKICESEVLNVDRNLATKKEEWKAKEKEENEKMSQIHTKNTKEKERLSLSIETLKTEHKDQIEYLKIQKDNCEALNANLQKDLAEEREKTKRLEIEREKITESLEENFKDFLDMAEVHENYELICVVKQKLDACETEIKKARESLNKFEKSEGFKGSSLSNIIDSIHQNLEKSKTTIELMRTEQYLTANGILKELVENYEEGDPDKVLEALQNEVRIHIKELKEIKEKGEEFESENEKLAETIKDNQNQLSNMRENEEKLKQEINSLKHSINAFNQKQKEFSELNGELKLKLLRCEEEAKQKEVKSEILFKQRDEKVEQNLNVLKEKEEQLQTYANQLQEYTNQLQELRPILQAKEQHIKEHLKEIEYLKDKIDTQENEIDRLEDKAKKLSEKCEGYEGQLSTNKKESEDLNKERNERILDYEKQLKSCEDKLEEIQRELANLANKHIGAQNKSEQQEIHSYHQAIEYFDNLISKSSSSSTSKKEDLFHVPSLSKSFESQENWINNLISLYTNSTTFTSKFIARFEFTSPKELETYLSEPNILLICETNFKKVFGIFICKISKLIKELDPVVLFSSDYSLAYPSEPKKGSKCRPAMILASNLALAKKEIVIEKSLQVCLENGEYFGDIDKNKVFGIENNESKFKIEKMEIHRIVTEQ